MTYQYKLLDDFFVFGEAKGGRLGNNSTEGEIGITRLPMNVTTDIQKVESCRNHSIFLTSAGEAYLSGVTKTLDLKLEFALLKASVAFITVGRSSIALVTKEQELLMLGKSKANHFKKDND